MIRLWCFLFLSRISGSLNRYIETLYSLREEFDLQKPCHLPPEWLDIDTGDDVHVRIYKENMVLEKAPSDRDEIYHVGKTYTVYVYRPSAISGDLTQETTNSFLNEHAILYSLKGRFGIPRLYRISNMHPDMTPNCLSRIFVTDYVGSSLYELQKESDSADILLPQIAIDALRILKKIHAAGIVHGGICSRNLRIDERQNIHLVNFYSSTLYIDPITHTHVSEVAIGGASDNNRPLSRRDDFRSLAVALVSLTSENSLLSFAFEDFYDHAVRMEFSDDLDYEYWIAEFIDSDES